MAQELTMQCFSDQIIYTSYAEKMTYKIPLGEGKINMLTNKLDGAFKITELEVWSAKLPSHSSKDHLKQD